MAVTDFTPIGARFGLLTVSSAPFRKEGKQNHFHVHCKCDCGGEKTVQCYNLTKGATTSCGCAQKRAAAKAQTRRPNIAPGDVFGRLTVVGEPFKRSSPEPWLIACRCECGTDKIAQCRLLVIGNQKSCGCLDRDVVVQRNKGMSTHGRTSTPTYRVWRGMKSRCLNPNSDAYADYGGRGIKICDRWLNSFENFLADMGERPAPEYSIDRIEVNLGYEPGNCRWATMQVQNENRRSTVWIEHNGEVKTLSRIAREVGIDKATLHSRLKTGWTLQRATTEPVRSRK